MEKCQEIILHNLHGKRVCKKKNQTNKGGEFWETMHQYTSSDWKEVLI